MDKKTRKLLDECWASIKEWKQVNKEMKELSKEVRKALYDR